MAKQLPLYPIQSGSGVNSQQVSASGIPRAPRVSVPRTRIPRIDTSTAGTDSVQRGLSMLARAFGGIAEDQRESDEKAAERRRKEYDEKIEIARNSQVVQQSVVIKNSMQEAMKPFLELRGSDAVGAPKKFMEQYEDLKEKLMIPGSDSEMAYKTLTILNSQFNSALAEIHNHELKQLDVARSDGNAAIEADARASANSIGISKNTFSDLEAIAEVAADKWGFVNGTEERGVAPENHAKVKRVLLEELLDSKIREFIGESPDVVEDWWTSNKDYFREHMPTKYAATNKLVEGVKEAAAYNRGLKILNNKYGNDFFGAAQEVITKDFIDKNLDGEYDTAYQIARTMTTMGSAQDSRTREMKAKLERSALQTIYERVTEGGESRFDYIKGVELLRAAVIDKKIPADTGLEIINRWTNRRWTPEDTEDVKESILESFEDDPENFNHSDILKLAGPGAPFGELTSFFSRIKADYTKGLYGTDYIKEGVDAFDNVVKSLPASTQKDFLENNNRDKFRKKLRNKMNREGWSLYDDRLGDYYLEQLTRYKVLTRDVRGYKEGEVVPVTTDLPGIDVWVSDEKWGFELDEDFNTSGEGGLDIPPEVQAEANRLGVKLTTQEQVEALTEMMKENPNE